MGIINRLEQSVIDQIAAGEIIERPASVVKELVENSIDAGATEITVDIEKGGRKLIRIADNGHGILPEDLPLAMLAHATSKLSSPDDLFTVSSLGFRGEALASIASVSEFSLASRPKTMEFGTKLTCKYGICGDVEEVGMATGTVSEVKNLFSNLPVRLKFMKTPSVETSHSNEMLVRFALAFPAITF